MKCPVCDNVNTSMLCPKCGFDSSRDYEKYPTFGPVGRVPAVSARVFRTGARNSQASTKPWRRNILRSDKVPNDFKLNYTEYTVFGSDYQRKQISSVTFLDTLAYMPDDAWDVSEAGNGTVMTWVKPNGELYDLYIGAEGGVCAGTSCEQLFAGYCCAGYITFGDAFHTENVQNMGDMFMNCYNLKDLDLSGFDTSNVQQMYYMFAYCRNFTVLDLSAFNTSNVNNMAAMFMGCGRLSELNVSRFDTSKVRVMNFMFENCEKLSTLDLSSFDVSCVTQMHSMFANCPAGGNYKDLFLKPKKEVPTKPAQREKPEKHEPAPVRPEPIPVPVKQPTKVPVWLMAVVCMLTMVLGIWVGTGVRKSDPTEPGESAQMQEPVETTESAGQNSNVVRHNSWRENVLRSDEVSDGVWPDESGAYEYSVFGSDYQRKQISTITFLDTLKDITADAWDVSESGDGSVMAWVKPSGELYDLYIGAEGGLRAGESCADMFMGYIYVNRISFNSAFHTDGTVDMHQMFRDCSSLEKLDLSRLNTSEVRDMNAMFCDCSDLKELDLSGVHTENVNDMGYMFYYCSSLKELDLSGFNTAQVRDMSYMFWHCSSLTELDLRVFNTANVRNMRQMFRYCEMLTDLDISGFDTSKVQDMTDMFWCCPAGEKWSHLLY